MTWDERGRLWVALTIDYPNELQPAGQGPRPHRHLRGHRRRRQGRQGHRLRREAEHPDEPDLRPRRRDRLRRRRRRSSSRTPTATARPTCARCCSAAGRTRDTHAGPSNLQYGLDNWIYGMQSATPASRLTVGGERHRFRQGFFRFKPDGSKLEFLRSTNNNTWGLGISEEGIVFGSTANGNPSVYMPIPNRYYEAVRGWSSSRAARHRRHATASSRSPRRSGRWTSTAASPPRPGTPCTPPAPTRRSTGTAPRSSPSRPGTWSRRSCSRRDGSRLPLDATPGTCSPATTSGPRPIMAEVGPDGNVWVIDWYNFIVQHNPTPQGFKTGKGNAYETRAARQEARPHLPHRLHGGDEPAKPAHARWPTRRRRSWSRR